MAKVAVRRLGLSACTRAEYSEYKKIGKMSGKTKKLNKTQEGGQTQQPKGGTK